MKENMFKVTLVILFLSEIVTSENLLAQLTSEEIECLAEDKVLYYKDKQCYKLLRKGPCEDGKWLVLDKSKFSSQNITDQLSPICQNVPCQGRQVYWAKTRSCIHVRDEERVCGSETGTELINDVFGEGECTCIRDPPHSRMGGSDTGSCHPLYNRGPCPLGMTFGFPDNDTEKAECIADLCYENSLKKKKDKTMDENGVLVSWEDGQCYELGTRGPCPEESTLKVHSKTLVPSCISHTNQILQFERPSNCYEDQSGKCQKVVSIKSKEDTAEKYMNELFTSFNSIRKRRWAARRQRQRRN